MVTPPTIQQPSPPMRKSPEPAKSHTPIPPSPAKNVPRTPVPTESRKDEELDRRHEQQQRNLLLQTDVVENLRDHLVDTIGSKKEKIILPIKELTDGAKRTADVIASMQPEDRYCFYTYDITPDANLPNPVVRIGCDLYFELRDVLAAALHEMLTVTKGRASLFEGIGVSIDAWGLRQAIRVESSVTVAADVKSFRMAGDAADIRRLLGRWGTCVLPSGMLQSHAEGFACTSTGIVGRAKDYPRGIVTSPGVFPDETVVHKSFRTRGPEAGRMPKSVASSWVSQDGEIVVHRNIQLRGKSAVAAFQTISNHFLANHGVGIKGPVRNRSSTTWPIMPTGQEGMRALALMAYDRFGSDPDCWIDVVYYIGHVGNRRQRTFGGVSVACARPVDRRGWSGGAIVSLGMIDLLAGDRQPTDPTPTKAYVEYVKEHVLKFDPAGTRTPYAVALYQPVPGIVGGTDVVVASDVANTDPALYPTLLLFRVHYTVKRMVDAWAAKREDLDDDYVLGQIAELMRDDPEAGEYTVAIDAYASSMGLKRNYRRADDDAATEGIAKIGSGMWRPVFETYPMIAASLGLTGLLESLQRLVPGCLGRPNRLVEWLRPGAIAGGRIPYGPMQMAALHRQTRVMGHWLFAPRRDPSSALMERWLFGGRIPGEETEAARARRRETEWERIPATVVACSVCPELDRDSETPWEEYRQHVAWSVRTLLSSEDGRGALMGALLDPVTAPVLWFGLLVISETDGQDADDKIFHDAMEMAVEISTKRPDDLRRLAGPRTSNTWFMSARIVRELYAAVRGRAFDRNAIVRIHRRLPIIVERSAVVFPDRGVTRITPRHGELASMARDLLASDTATAKTFLEGVNASLWKSKRRPGDTALCVNVLEWIGSKARTAQPPDDIATMFTDVIYGSLRDEVEALERDLHSAGELNFGDALNLALRCGVDSPDLRLLLEPRDLRHFTWAADEFENIHFNAAGYVAMFMKDFPDKDYAVSCTSDVMACKSWSLCRGWGEVDLLEGLGAEDPAVWPILRRALATQFHRSKFRLQESGPDLMTVEEYYRVVRAVTVGDEEELVVDVPEHLRVSVSGFACRGHDFFVDANKAVDEEYGQAEAMRLAYHASVSFGEKLDREDVDQLNEYGVVRTAIPTRPPPARRTIDTPPTPSSIGKPSAKRAARVAGMGEKEGPIRKKINMTEIGGGEIAKKKPLQTKKVAISMEPGPGKDLADAFDAYANRRKRGLKLLSNKLGGKLHGDIYGHVREAFYNGAFLYWTINRRDPEVALSPATVTAKSIIELRDSLMTHLEVLSRLQEKIAEGDVTESEAESRSDDPVEKLKTAEAKSTLGKGLAQMQNTFGMAGPLSHGGNVAKYADGIEDEKKTVMARLEALDDAVRQAKTAMDAGLPNNTVEVSTAAFLLPLEDESGLYRNMSKAEVSIATKRKIFARVDGASEGFKKYFYAMWKAVAPGGLTPSERERAGSDVSTKKKKSTSTATTTTTTPTKKKEKEKGLPPKKVTFVTPLPTKEKEKGSSSSSSSSPSSSSPTPMKSKKKTLDAQYDVDALHGGGLCEHCHKRPKTVKCSDCNHQYCGESCFKAHVC